MARPRKSDREYNNQIRDLIISSAEQIFASHGFTAATTRRIAARAGVNKNLIFYYFGSKEGLYQAILTKNIGPVISSLLTILANDDPLDIKTDAIIEIYFDAFTEKAETLPRLLVRELADGAPYFAEIIAGQIEDVKPLMMRIFQTDDFSFDNYLKLGGLISVILFAFLLQPVRSAIARKTGVQEPQMSHIRAQLTEFIKYGINH
ncbi:MAG: TetR/AcrR family transcriptional regulator [FCB group bacterium]|nr:TetR/AcrR family transcriptional regulator [FCB group bacterium]